MNFIDLENSYIYFNPNENNCCRVAIKSILLDVKENTYYYLTKECRAELIGIKPFDHKSKSELCVVVDSDKNKYLIIIIIMPIVKKKIKFLHFLLNLD